MSQRHLYNGVEMSPPVEWATQGISLIEDADAIVTESEDTVLTWVGNAAEFIINEWIPINGVYQGVPYQIIGISEITSLEVIIFDGFIDVSRKVELSKINPISFQAPKVSRVDNTHVFTRSEIITQALLVKNGFLTGIHYKDVPVVIESKKSLSERAVIIAQLSFNVVGSLIRIIQDFLSAIADIAGISAPIGILEAISFFISVIIELTLLVQNILVHKNLFFPEIRYYKGLSMYTFIIQGFASMGYTVDFGVITETLKKIYILPSNNNADQGKPLGILGVGALNPGDFGYTIPEALQTVQDMFNTRQNVLGDIISIKNKFDPSLILPPEFEPDNILIETTDQYSNGRKEIEPISGVVVVDYVYDASDSHTLTESTSDSHEVHRGLLTELNPDFTTLKGIEEHTIQFSMAVRKDFSDFLLSQFNEVRNKFNEWLTNFKSNIFNVEGEGEIPDESDVSSIPILSEILDFPLFSELASTRDGALKTDDNTWGKPKIVYLEDTAKGPRIPKNYKDFIGAPALYNNWRQPDSPADINDYKGQNTIIRGWTIRFNTDDFNTVRNNPYFVLDSKNAKFIRLDFVENDNEAVVDVRLNEIFDKNITEFEV